MILHMPGSIGQYSQVTNGTSASIMSSPKVSLNLMIILWKSLAGLMVRMEMIGVDENDNKPELEDASHYYVDDFNDATCEVCL